MLHATVNGKKTLDLNWDGQSTEGKLNDVAFVWDALHSSPEHMHVLHQNKSYNVEVVQLNAESKEAIIKVNGNKYTVQLKDRFDDLLKSLGMETTGDKKLKDLKAPMPGLVLDILVAEGTVVEKDTPLLILEAMKMENVIKSPAAGTVKKVNAIKGNAVEKNAVLLEFV
jgi:biotin carboxyl carrier protein